MSWFSKKFKEPEEQFFTPPPKNKTYKKERSYKLKKPVEIEDDNINFDSDAMI